MSKTRRFLHRWWPIFALFAMPLQIVLLFSFVGLSLYTKVAKSRWDAHLAELAKLGEFVDSAKLAPPPVENPDENFAEAPIVKSIGLRSDEEETRDEENRTREIFTPRKIARQLPLKRGPTKYSVYQSLENAYFEGNVENLVSSVLQHIEENRDEFESLRKAAHRKFSNENLSYESLSTISERDFGGLMGSVQALALCTNVFIEIGDSDRALKNIDAQIRISSHIAREPSLISILVAIACYDRTVENIQFGLVKKLWTSEQCETLSELLAGVDFEAQAMAGFRMERALSQSMLREYLDGPGVLVDTFGELPDFLAEIRGPDKIHLPHFLCDGWFYENFRVASEAIQQELLTKENGELRHSSFPLTHDLELIRSRLTATPLSTFRYKIAEASLRAYSHALVQTKRTKTYIDHARIALALESFRIKNGRIPDSLLQIEEDRKETFPQDLHTGKPYRYEKLGQGNYLLYGVGHNLTDDGGKIRRKREYGDWVWFLELPKDFDESDYNRRQ